MSKQSNQRYRKEKEQSSNNTTNDKASNTTSSNEAKNQSNRFTYGEDEFDSLSNDYDDESDYY